MHPINVFLSLSSTSVVAVTIERFSFTTKVLLQPYDFLRLHEVFQIAILILATVLIPFLMLRYVTDEFRLLKGRMGFLLGALFITGIYFYSTGNGVHEIASFAFNTYCNTKVIEDVLCGGMFINDYYFGNGLYFIGAILMNTVLITFERMNPIKTFGRKDLPLLILNSLVYALAIFAYAAFDRVLVGLIYSIVMTGILLGYFFTARRKYTAMPLTTSLLISYTLGLFFSLIIRLFLR